MPRRKPTPDDLLDVRAQTPAADDLVAVVGQPRTGSPDWERLMGRGPVAPPTGRQDIPLDLIDDNPWQPRQDYEGIDELAADIQRNGLLQIPAGRRMADGRVQLQYGHRRLRAVRALGWPTMPVDLQPVVSDNDMAIRAWVENHNRQDFTALDQARYFKRLMDDGWTQQQIADKLGMARPTVSNSVRLLKLPPDLQTKIAETGLSARKAEALLALLEIPEELRQQAERTAWYDDIRPTRIVAKALAGTLTSDQIRANTQTLLERSARTVQQEPWYRHPMRLTAEMAAARCDSCPEAIKRDTGVYCPVEACRQAKIAQWYDDLLAPAAAAVGLPVGTPPTYQGSQGTESFAYAHQPFVEEIFAEQPLCANLQVVHAPGGAGGAHARRVDGHPDAMIVCRREGGSCTCLSKRQAAQTRAGADDAKKTSQKVWNAMAADALPIIAMALRDAPDHVLRLVAPNIDPSLWYPDGSHGGNALAALSYDDLVKRLASNLIDKRFVEYLSPKHNRDVLTAMIHATGFSAPWEDPPTPASPPPAPANRISSTLAALSNEIDDYQVPGDGLPTQERMAAILDQLRETIDNATAHATGDDLAVIQHQYRNIWPDALALNDRVQASHAAE